jgi:quercetin dioxygenase-like cupin family protein
MVNKAATWDDIEPVTVIAGFHGRFVHSETMTFALWRIDKGALLPSHSHFHEQVIHLLEGELEVTVDGVIGVLKAGMVGIVPRNAVHSGRALTDCRVLDVFSPKREDYADLSGLGILQAAAAAPSRG